MDAHYDEYAFNALQVNLLQCVTFCIIAFHFSHNVGGLTKQPHYHTGILSREKEFWTTPHKGAISLFKSYMQFLLAW